MPDAADFVALRGVSKSFGAVRALDGADFEIARGRCVGLVGHNGAGKSTLVHILNGGLRPDAGTVEIDGVGADAYSTARADAIGVRCVYQELSLCPNLSVADNAYVFHPGLRGFGWRKRAGALIRAKLDEIFPGHGVAPTDVVSELPIGKRQQVEIARAFTVTDRPAALVVLDEPTSSLDGHSSRQLLGYLREFIRGGGSCVLISHLLGEVLSVCDDVTVMRDGRRVASGPVGQWSRARLIAAMGAQADAASAAATGGPARRDRAVVASASPRRQADRRALQVREGEIVGLAGLAGHGQTDFLLDVFNHSYSAAPGAAVAFVAGDRQNDGIFPNFSIARNIGLRSLGALKSWMLLSPAKERALAEAWRTKVGIRAPDVEAPILSLSGGNQQKALFARALASEASLVLMDDPMRGVDYGTKLEVYALVRAEAARGRTFIWYTTETDELKICDHVYVFREGEVVADFSASAVSEEAVIGASFADAAAG